MAELLVAVLAAKTDDSSSTTEEYEGDLIGEINPYGLHNMRTINPNRSDRLSGPITLAVVADALFDEPTTISQERYQKRKPIFVRASLNKNHLKPGEATNMATDLRNIIRSRGRSPDDCGHVIGRSVNGYMVDYNLFPQHMNINRGIFGNYFFWRAAEVAMRLFLTLVPISFSPRVEFNMLLTYSDVSKPDRPSKFKYLVNFYIKRRSSDDNKEQGRDGETLLLQATKEILNIAKQAIKNRSRSTVRDKIIEVIRRFGLQEHQKIEILTFVDELEEIFLQVEVSTSRPASQPSPSSQPSSTASSSSSSSTSLPVYRHRPHSIVDYVPVVGGLRSVYHAAQDFHDGNILKGIGNTTLGAASLALDAVSFGGASTVGKALVKGSGKAIAERVAAGAVCSTMAKLTLNIWRK